MTNEDRKKELQEFYIRNGKECCKRCDRKLKNPKSLLRQLGPVCYLKTFKIDQLKLGIKKT